MVTLTALDVLEGYVKEGASRLDNYQPGWRARIDVGLIEADCTIHSVAGQLFGGDLIDQLLGVGLYRDDVENWEIIGDMARMGFVVLAHEPVPVPQAVRDALMSAATQLGEMLAQKTGMDASQFTPAVPPPSVFPAPRDPDLVAHETAALTLLWEREAAKR